MPTIDEVARACGVSKATVSNVMTGNRPVAKATCDRVLRAIKELDYYPCISAQNLAGRRTRTLAIVYPLLQHRTFSGETSAEFIIAAANAINTYGYKLLLATFDYDNTDGIIELVRGHYVDGIILMSIRMNDPRATILKNEGFPFVMIGRGRQNTGIDFTDVDEEYGVYQATKELVSHGHRRIAYVGVLPYDFGFSRRCLKGFRRALREQALTCDTNLVVNCHPNIQEGRVVFARLWKEGGGFTAAVICSDIVAAGFMEAARTGGVRIPDDLSLISFGNSLLCTLTTPPLTAISLCAGEMMQKAVDILVGKLGGEKSVQRVLMRPELVRRETVSRVPGIVGL